MRVLVERLTQVLCEALAATPPVRVFDKAAECPVSSEQFAELGIDSMGNPIVLGEKSCNPEAVALAVS
ncbi:hypothetical protein [Nocardia nepalensis]|uniref:hypothetical protein n=1 Tax=Nocardia nepalensis TaxID=3375448 RepID=UPI003B67AB4D